MGTMLSKIRFSRSEITTDSKQVALERLRLRTWIEGEPAVVKYYLDETKTKTSMLYAIGTGNGTGTGYYRLIYPEDFTLINGVVIGENPPGVTLLVHDELYLYNNPSDTNWYYVYAVDGLRKIEPVTDEEKTFVDIIENNIWVSGKDRIVRKLNDIYSSGEIDAIVKDLKDLIKTIGGEAGVDLTIVFERLDALEAAMQNVPDKTEIEGQIYEVDSKVEQKVDKEEGKGLSSNDFTDEEKDKLDTIEPGDKNIIEVIKLNNDALDVVNKTVEIDLTSYAKKTDLDDIYTKEEAEETFATKEEIESLSAGYCLHISVDDEWTPLVESELTFDETADEINEIIEKYINSDGTTNLKVNIKDEDGSYDFYLCPCDFSHVIDNALESFGKTIIGENEYEYTIYLNGSESSLTWKPIENSGDGNSNVVVVNVTSDDYVGQYTDDDNYTYELYQLSDYDFDELFTKLKDKHTDLKACIGLQEVIKLFSDSDEEEEMSQDALLSFDSRIINEYNTTQYVEAVGRSGRELKQGETFSGLELDYRLSGYKDLEPLPQAIKNLITLEDGYSVILFYIRKNESNEKSGSTVKPFSLTANTNDVDWEEIKAGNYPIGGFDILESSEILDEIRTWQIEETTDPETGVTTVTSNPAKINLSIKFPVGNTSEQGTFHSYVFTPSNYSTVIGPNNSYVEVDYYGVIEDKNKGTHTAIENNLSVLSGRDVKYRLRISYYSTSNATLYLEDIKPCVKSISVNGEAQEMDEDGNVNLIISTEGVHDDRITDDMIEYLNSKLAYTYTYGCTITSPVSSITLPSTTTSVTFTAQFSVTKRNDSGSKPISISSVSNVTTGWTEVEGSIGKYTKTVDITPSATTVSSGSVSGSVTNSDNKTGTANGTSKSVSLLKPWYIWEGTEEDFYTDGVFDSTKATEVISNLLDGTITPKKTSTSSYTKTGEKINIDTNGDVLWFALPNTFSSISVTQLSINMLRDAKLTAVSSIGNYTVYRSKQTLDSGEFIIDITIK